MHEIRWDVAPDGRPKAWVCEVAERIVLRQCADIVQNSFGGEARDRVGGSDLVFWDFMIGNTLITLQFEKGVGIAVFANDSSAPSTDLVRQIAARLLT